MTRHRYPSTVPIPHTIGMPHLLVGSCEVLLVCSTCHVIVIDVVYYNKLEDPTDVEYDILDLDFDAAAPRKSPNSTSMTRWKDQLDPTLMDLYP
ncbi:2Fe-2S ferredoxin [Capsicum chinense]|nr:2Fe-2S ferredoxin [Capsicum chinense]